MSTTTEKGESEPRTTEHRELDKVRMALDEARIEIARLRAELAAARTQARHLSTIFERAPMAIFVKDLDGRYVDGNPTAASMLGRTIEELMSLDDEDLFGSEAALEIRDIDQYVTTTNRPFRYEARRYTPQGERVFQTTKWPRLDDRNETIGIIAMSREVTDDKYAREYYALQSAIAGVDSIDSPEHDRMSLLSHAVRSALASDLAILWSDPSGNAPEVVHHSAVRPGFGESLLRASSEGWILQALQSEHPLVRPTASSDDARLRAAANAGLFTVFTIPIRSSAHDGIIECFTSERRAGTRRFLENLREASLRIRRGTGSDRAGER